MSTLFAERKDADSAGDGGAPPSDGPPTGGDGSGGEPAAPVARACENCGASMAKGQDWCLECGTAAPGRLGSRPGWRAASTIVAVTLLLVAGAVAASYAALSDDANQEASKAPGPSATPVPQQNDQASVPTAPAVTPPPAFAPPATTPTTPTTSTPTTSTPTTSTPAIPSIPTIPQSSTPTFTVPSTTTPTPTPTSTSPKTTPTNTSTSTTPTKTSTTTTPSKPAAPTAIDIAAGAGDLYDPYGRATDKGDPADAYDGDTKTSWKVVTPTDGKEMQVGYVVNLGTAKHVSQIVLQTGTPGFRLEVYGADGSEKPSDILDTRWTHVASRSKVDASSVGSNKSGDGTEKVVLPKDGDKFHWVLLWFTTPPKDATVGISEIKLFG